MAEMRPQIFRVQLTKETLMLSQMRPSNFFSHGGESGGVERGFKRQNNATTSSDSGSQCTQSGIFNPSNHTTLQDNNATVAYSGNWTIVSGSSALGDLSQHETFAQNASIFAPFSGSQIMVVGTVPNGTDNITASYSIDDGTPQTRSVPSHIGCDILDEPFFMMTGLKEEQHNITITVLQVGNRPFMFNFFALDLKDSSSGITKGKSVSAGFVAGIVAAGVVVCLLVCASVFALRRRSARLRMKRSSIPDNEKHDVDLISICSTCREHRVGTSSQNLYASYCANFFFLAVPFSTDNVPHDTASDGDASSGIVEVSRSGPPSVVGHDQRRSRTPISRSFSKSFFEGVQTQATRVSNATRAMRGSRKDRTSRSFPPIQTPDGPEVELDVSRGAEGAWGSRRISSGSSTTFVCE
ncbi:hypothetical protein SCHPADRAFT_940447 [Schizopora paradoxa]|uniref:Uncharacterized protein n=1 Tax=Schizopora paradoxa TaxID=27342 RepID=A0A0H2RMX2_9AGAM|nr:hypothetical protein SCHPADRAFT_940447 [Schizopora paradoxa]